MQPRRQQILDLIAWFEAQLAKLQVKVELNTFLEAGEVEAYGPDVVIVATGSQPSAGGFQRGLPLLESIPGSNLPNVHPAADVMSRAAKLGKRVIVLDDEGNWKGCGTALHLAVKGHEVSIIAANDLVGAEIKRTSADIPLRRELKRLGVRMITESGVSEWHGDAATVVNFLDGSTQRLFADSLVLATTNVPERGLHDALVKFGASVHLIGDAVAAREANVAIFEARRLASAL